MDLKDTLTEKKNILEGFSRRLNEAAERISNLEDRKVGIHHNRSEEIKVFKRPKWYNIKKNNSLIVGVPEREERKWQNI